MTCKLLDDNSKDFLHCCFVANLKKRRKKRDFIYNLPPDCFCQVGSPVKIIWYFYQECNSTTFTGHCGNGLPSMLIVLLLNLLNPIFAFKSLSLILSIMSDSQQLHNYLFGEKFFSTGFFFNFFFFFNLFIGGEEYSGEPMILLISFFYCFFLLVGYWPW